MPPPGAPQPGAAPFQPTPAYQAVPAAAAPSGSSNGAATAALVLGILTFFCLGPVGALLAIILGFIGLKKAKEIGVGRGSSIAGIVLGGIGMVASVAVFIIFVVAGVTIGSNVNHIGGKADSGWYQVTPGNCQVDSYGDITFDGTIKNTSGSKKNFTVNVEFRNKSTNAVIDTGSDLVTDIAKGDTAQWNVSSSNSTSGGQVSCKVTEVDNWFN